MKLRCACPTSNRAVRPAAGFSLIELLLAVTIMGVIVAALYSVFNQTQRAMRSNATQVDVLEAGRATMDVLTRELEQLSFTGLGGRTNLFIGLAGTDTNHLSQAWRKPRVEYEPVIQPLMGDREYRTNHRDGVFYLTRQGKELTGTALWVVDATNGVGTLARYSARIPVGQLGFIDLLTVTGFQPLTNYVRLADGVVHFRLVAFDAQGFPMIWQKNLTNRFDTNLVELRRDPLGPTETQIVFRSNALPASIEIELGILEPQALEQLRSLPNDPAVTRRFLSNRVGQVHLFRQRVPIRQSVPSYLVAR